MLNQCEKEENHELAGVRLAITRKFSYDLERSGIAHAYLPLDSAMLTVAMKLMRSKGFAHHASFSLM